MKNTRLAYWFIIGILPCINLYVLIHRNEGYKYFPYKTYSELYVSDSMLYLKDLRFTDDSLELFFSMPLSTGGYIFNDNSKPILPFAKTNSIKFLLNKSLFEYRLFPVDSSALPIIIQVDHGPDSNNPSHQYINEFLYCNLPGPDIKIAPYNLWTKSALAFKNDEILKGAELLKSKTNTFNLVTDSGKLMEICRFMSSLRPNPNGIAAGEAAKKTPYEQLQLAVHHKTNLECGNYAGMLYYLCCVAGLPSRVITYRGSGNNWRYGVHYFNEIYLREKQQWVVADALSNIYLPHDSARYFNAVDVNKMARVNGFNGKYVYTFRNDSLGTQPYDSVNYWHTYYNRSNADLCFLHPGADLNKTSWDYLAEFYSFRHDFDLYSDINANNWLKIIVKLMAFYIFLAVLFCYIVFELKKIRKHKTLTL